MFCCCCFCPFCFLIRNRIAFSQMLSYWDDPLIFLFWLLIWWITLIGFWMLNQPSIPEVNLTYSLCIFILHIEKINFAKVLFRIFTSMVMRNISLCFSILFMSVKFCCFSNADLIEWIGRYYPLFNILKLLFIST